MSDDKPTNIHVLFGGPPPSPQENGSPDPTPAEQLAAFKLPVIPIRFAGTEPFIYTRVILMVLTMVAVSGIFECGRHLNRIATALEQRQ